MTGTLETPLSDADYHAIEAAVMETARGRWFLNEYARRNRVSDTGEVLGAIRRLETAMTSERSSGEIDRIRFDLIDMAGAIARTKQEIASIRPDSGDDKIDEASIELDAIVKATESATGDILAAGEHLQEIAWQLREQGHEGATADIIEQRATDIYLACSFQDITGQRTRKVIGVLKYLEARLDAMTAIWGAQASPPPALVVRSGDAALLNGPALPGHGLDQGDIDAMMATTQPAATPDQASPAVEAPAPVSMPALPPLPPLSFTPEDVELTWFEPEDPVRTDGVPVPDAVASEAAAPSPTVSRPEPPAIVTAPLPQSPFTPVVRPRPPKPALSAEPTRRPVTLADIEALSYEEKSALFS